ncbi:S26 family signal peptidase [Streptomyces sp. Ncost-T10-10d]|uniref:S26 family signal peptidase n=1 Tax=Streptomyces sp. Ncost-T10-10d TaxID=1839774 RepID=UPI00081F4C60|nr:S26 family signal peptidase [Streptomyces sp. Ncost-T10-10d]SCF83361.1 Signal peptidase I [Streptomyces sp. Ncost-T10-10d]
MTRSHETRRILPGDPLPPAPRHPPSSGPELRALAAPRAGQNHAPDRRAAPWPGPGGLVASALAALTIGAGTWALTGFVLAGVLILVPVFVLASLGVAAVGSETVVVTVRGASMEPAYHDGDRVLVRRNRAFESGTVVVVEHPAGSWTTAPPPIGASGPVTHRNWMIKRVMAVPGDPVPRTRVPALAETPDDRVPAGQLVLLGDNPEVSFDSREVGYFPAERVLGVVLRRRIPSVSTRGHSVHRCIRLVRRSVSARVTPTPRRALPGRRIAGR